MAIITLTSDFGERDHYVGALKGAILSKNPSQVLVDISHQIQSFDLAHAAFVLRSAYATFPKGTIHIVAVDTIGNLNDAHLAVKLNNHFFLLTDHGLLGLISEHDPEMVVELKPKEDQPGSFPALELLAPVAVELANGTAIEKLGNPTTEYKKMVGRKMRANKDQLIGHVLRVDHYGNLITNIRKEEFCEFSKSRSFAILIGREQFKKLNTSISETGSGDCYVMFNSLGLLEVGINKGNASELMGLQFDSPIKISFGE